MNRKMSGLFAILAIAMISIWASMNRPARAQSGLANPGISPRIDKIMELIGSGKIDDALASMDSFKDHAAEREEIRGKLIEVWNSQQHYNGFDVVATQRFSDRLEAVWVLAYYEQAPVLFRFVFYHPTGRADQPWGVVGFNIRGDAIEELKDVPLDYLGHSTR